MVIERKSQKINFLSLLSTKSKEIDAETALTKIFESFEKCGCVTKERRISSRKPEVNQKSLSRKSKFPVTHLPITVRTITERANRINLVLLFIFYFLMTGNG
jgi:hypothetical protein